MIDPLPRHSVHGSENPKAPWLRLMTPAPLQFGQTLGLVPGRAPLPWQFVHGAGLVSRNGIATPLGGLEETQFGLGLEVVAPPGAARPRLLSASAEQPTEQVTDVRAAGLPGSIEQVVEVELLAIATAEPAESATAGTAPAEPAAREEPTGLVVLLAFGGVGQHFLGLGGGLVPLLGRGVAGVSVGVVLGEDLAGSPLDLVLGGVGGDAELLVEVLLNPLTLGHTASPPHLRRGCQFL